MENLFKDMDGNVYSKKDIQDKLKMIGADECDTLFIHSDVMFGTPVAGFGRKQYLQILYDVIRELGGGKNIIVPTFTYSFCNGEIYDVLKSRTSMGAFNEFIRNQEGRYRTMDPLLSVSVPVELKNHFLPYHGQHSLGEKSGLDALHHMDGVKFLFFGAEMRTCFTYVHYVEKMLDVPYRFDMEFQGQVVDEAGNQTDRTQYIHTQCYGVKLPEHYGYFEDELMDMGLIKKVRLGNGHISCLDEKDAYRQISERIQKNINYFLKEPYKESDLIHRYTYDAKNGRITHC